jgi:hypothetical protein
MQIEPIELRVAQQDIAAAILDPQGNRINRS